MKTRLSVVMPAYNEESCIVDAVVEVQRYVLDQVRGAELIVVDDGSVDRTGVLLDKIATSDPRVAIIHQPNSGHGPALYAGLQAARGEYLFVVDSDRQIPLSAFEGLWNDAQCADGALGIRVKRSDPPLRLFLTCVIRTVIGFMFGARLYDANVPFKLIRRKIWEEARLFIPEDTLAPSLFLAVFAMRAEFAIRFRRIPHRERQNGFASIRRWKLLRFCARGLQQLLVFRWRLESHSRDRRSATMKAVGVNS